MSRNIQKQALIGEKILENNDRYSLSNDEFMQIMEKHNAITAENNSFDALWKTVSDVFKMGIAVGSRIEKARSMS